MKSFALIFVGILFALPLSWLAENPSASLAADIDVKTPAKVIKNYNDGSPRQPEFPEHFYRSALPGRGPVPAISDRDLAHGIKPELIAGRVQPLSGPPERLTDGSGAASEDDPAGSFFCDNGVPLGRLRISLPEAHAIGQINFYAWHRNALSGGVRAPLKINIYASDGTSPGFDANNPQSPGYVLLAGVDTVRPGGVQAQDGQHGASVVPANGQTLGKFRHFIFELLPPVDGLDHTFLNEIDIVGPDTAPAEIGPAAATVSRTTTAAGQHFDTQIAPLLARRCLDCHNGTDKKGGLDLSRADAAMAGGESGAAIAPGQPDKSFLIERIVSDEMPPKHPLMQQEKQLLREWIAAGAHWGTSPLTRFRFTSDSRAGADWWALQPLTDPKPPTPKDKLWAKRPLDNFILARLEASGLSPAPAATARALIRRVTFDLTGLPPTPEEVEAFVKDESESAYERLVNRLLASPHYGERWARHWLDLVRFAESQGFERNKYYPSAWKYRDWVIQAFNDDMPYDEFVRLQLAADVLKPEDPAAAVATGYLAFGPYDLLGHTQGSAAMRANTREDELENLVGNIAQTFLGLTVNCARCHDHKFDPIYQSEYTQLSAAVGGFERTEREMGTSSPPGSAGDARSVLRESLSKANLGLVESTESAGQAAVDQARAEAMRQAESNLQTARSNKQTTDQALQAMQTAASKPGAVDEVMLAGAQQAANDRRREFLNAQDFKRYATAPYSTLGLDALLEKLPPDERPNFARRLTELSQLDMQDRLLAGGTLHGIRSAEPQYFRVLARGSFREPGRVVAAAGLSSIGAVSPDWGLSSDAPEAERRVRLARWITDPRNPLPSRVIVNRLWHYHFGAGLVETPNDFGFNGSTPSHPELLDALASDLVRRGWSLKHVQREIVLSAAYRQSSQPNQKAAQIDSTNRLLWRKSPVRLEAEAIRDAVLAVSGELNPRMGGPSFRDLKIDLSAANTGYEPVDDFSSAVNRRTIYRMVVRTATPPLLETLDCADPTVATPRRTVTTTPLQALSLLNNPLMERAAAAFAKRVQHEREGDQRRQVERAYQLALGRAATDPEQQAAEKFVAEHGLTEFCLLLFNTNEFVYLD